MKSVQIRSYFWSLFSCIRIECRKIRTRDNSVFGHISYSVYELCNKNVQHITLLEFFKKYFPVIHVILNALLIIHSHWFLKVSNTQVNNFLFFSFIISSTCLLIDCLFFFFCYPSWMEKQFLCFYSNFSVLFLQNELDMANE